MRIFLFILINVIAIISVIAQPHAEPDQQGLGLKERFLSSTGIGAIYYNNDINSDWIPVINFSPNLIVTPLFRNFSITLSSNLTLGYHLNNKQHSDNFIYFHAPAMLLTNIGHYASRKFEQNNGIFTGGGYDLTLIDNGLQGSYIICAGIRTWILKRSVTFRYSRLFPEKGGGYFQHHISAELNIGRFLGKQKDATELKKWIEKR